MNGGNLLGIAVALALGGCAHPPRLPGNRHLPVKEILLHSACDLRFAFAKLDRLDYKNFNAKKWIINITLTPKVNAERSLSIGTTGKSTTVNSSRYFNTYVLGAAPGAAASSKGHSDGSVTYVVRSKDLLDDKTFPLECYQEGKPQTDLTKGLDVKGWLLRTVEAGHAGTGNLTSVDKPTYTAQIYAKYNGSGSYTYNFPFGTAFAGASGLYDVEETLSIALTPDQTKTAIVVKTLPSGGNFGPSKPAIASTIIGPDPTSRLDEIQLEQSLRNLQLQVN